MSDTPTFDASGPVDVSSYYRAASRVSGVAPISEARGGLGAPFSPLGKPLGSHGILQGLEGIVTNNQTALRETQEVTRDIMVLTERAATMLGNVIERAQTLNATGAGVPGAGGDGSAMGLAFGALANGANPLAVMQALQSGQDPGTLGPTSVTPGQMLTQRTAAGSPTTTPAPGPQSGVTAPTAGAAPASGPQSGGTPRAKTKTGSPMSPEGMREQREQSPYPKGGDPNAPDEDEVPGFQLPQSWDEGIKSLSNLRTNVARGVNKSVSEWATQGKQQIVDPVSGMVIGEQRVPPGSPLSVAGEILEDGSVIPTGDVGWRAKAATRIKGVAGGMAEGQGLGAALTGGGLAKAAGWAGVAYAGTTMAINFAEEQRRQNMEFQSMLGGSNSEGFSERWRQNVWRFSQMGTMSGADAEAIYKGGIAQYGTQRDKRGEYQDAALSMYRRGIGAQESMAILDQAASSGNDSLYALADAIARVGKAAREAGESAEDGRRYFQQAMEASADSQSGITQILGAEALATMRLGMGDKLSDVDLSPIDSPVNTMKAAQLLGMPHADYTAGINSNVPIEGLSDYGAALQARGRDATVDWAVRNVDSSGVLRDQITRQLDRIGAAPGQGGTVSAEQIRRIANQVQADTNVSPVQIGSAVRAATGLQVSDGEAMEMYVRMFATMDFEKEEQDRQTALVTSGTYGDTLYTTAGKRYDLTDINPGQDEIWNRKGAGMMGEGEAPKGIREMREFLTDQFNLEGDSAASRELRFVEGFNESKDAGFRKTRDMRTQARNALLNQADSPDGVYNPIGAALWSNWDRFGDDARYVVKTKDGEITVNGYELVSEYGDQLMANPEDIRIIGGDAHDMTVGQALGVDGGVVDAPKVTSSKDKARVEGMSVEDAEEKAAEDQKETGNGRVEITASPELRRFFEFSTSGSAYQSYSWGYPPEPHVPADASGSRYSGGG